MTSSPRRWRSSLPTCFLLASALLLALTSTAPSVPSIAHAAPFFPYSYSLSPDNTKRQTTTDLDPAHYRTQLYKSDKIIEEFEDLLNSPTLDSCQMCRRGMRMAQEFSLEAPELVPGVLRILCARYSFLRLDSCAGLMVRLGPELAEIFSQMDVDGSDGYYACAYGFPGSCPVPKHQPANPTIFPKPKPVNATQPLPSGQSMQVLHFSDWHLDPLYRPGTEAKCSHNICCRDFGSWNDPGPIKKRASKWGEPKCDTPIALGLSALEAIQRFVPNATFGLFTGDIVSHDSWLITEKYVADLETRSYELFKKYLQEMRLYVVLGNHDSYPSDQAPARHKPEQYSTHQWLYDHVATVWEKNEWITSIEADYARSHNAMFMTRPMPGLKLITLNTDMFYVRNYYNMLDTDQDDPSGLFHDLILELQDSEDRNERVWIMGHMAPVTLTLPRSSILFQRVVARYSPHVIAGIFTGHYHQDKFIVMHDPDAEERTQASAVNVVYQGPSITPLDKANPAIRWYDVDPVTFSILDSHTVTADIITQADYWESHDLEPEWVLEYSARSTYSDPLHPLPAGEPLSPAFWQGAVERMKDDAGLFGKYIRYQSKSSAEAKECLWGTVCAEETRCELQASTVLEHDVCEAMLEIEGTRVGGKGGKKKPKPSRWKRFGVTRSGRVLDVNEYDRERGIVN
ncbi:MAG: Metallo-dependent phosphatase-like protein [Linnemannia elongata]|nr:MAG: Metallo-dependent phosphatase-like protein [Linnemannia elongata]